MTRLPPEPLHYELRIGVSGHRQLTDRDGVRRAVDALLDRITGILRDANERPAGPAGSPKSWLQRIDGAIVNAAERVFPWLPRTPAITPADRLTPLHLVAVTSLAKGADRIVADAVLARPSGSLQAVLPMPAHAYRADFTDADDLAEFDRLLARDPVPTLTLDTDPATEIDPAAARNEAYLQAGRRVVDSCEIMIVIWDGQPTRGRGGTGDIVRYAMDRGRVTLWIDATNPSAEPRLLRWRHDASHSQAGAASDPASCAMPIPQIARAISIDFHQLSAFNRDGGFRMGKWSASVDRHARELSNAAQAAGLPADRLQPVLEHLLPHYARADQLANLYHGLYVRGAIGLYALSATAVSVAAVQALLLPHHTWLICFEIAAMLLAVILLRIGRTEAWHEKWLQDRYVAERIRSAMFTRVAGTSLGGFDGAKPQDALPFYRGRGGWLTDIPDRLELNCPMPPRTSADMPAVQRFVVGAWLRDQSSWHRRNAHRRHIKAGRGHRIGQFLFCGTLVAATLHLMGVGYDGQGDHLAHVITVLSVLLPAWGAAVHAISSMLDHHRLGHRSEQMADLLEGIAQAVENAPSAAVVEAEVRRAAVAMSAENHEWLVSLAFRDLVLPA